MLLDEDKSKDLFAAAGIPVPHGMVVRAGDESRPEPFFPPPWIVKALVLSGGRGKAGGVLRAENKQALDKALDAVFALKIGGEPVRLARVEPAVEHERELYLSLSVSRDRAGMVLAASGSGGMDVESGANGSVRIETVDLPDGPTPYQVRSAFFALDLPHAAWTPFNELVAALWKAVRGNNLLLAEINPLVYLQDEHEEPAEEDEKDEDSDDSANDSANDSADESGNESSGNGDTGEAGAESADESSNGKAAASRKAEEKRKEECKGRFLALDAKCEIDSSAMCGRKDLEAYFEPSHLKEEERISRDAGFAYVSLTGSVGLLANGAGLAMATMDSLNLAGLPAANFLDLGGAADERRMGRALELLFGDLRVEAVFINLYGGILSCGDVAKALAAVLGGRPPQKPLVVRMAGNGASVGLGVLGSLAQPDIHVVGDMAEALSVLRTLTDQKEPARIVMPEDDWAPAPPASSHDAADIGAFPLCRESAVLVQGATGRVAGKHIELMRAYGTNVVAGVTPFKGGAEVNGLPVYDCVADACREHRIDASIIFVPGPFAADAALEAARAGIPWVVCITEGVPQQDMLAVLPKLGCLGTRLVGPNTPGVIVPRQCKIGIMPAEPFTPGPVAVFSRSGTLTYEAASRLSGEGMGQSFCLGIGGDPFTGLDFVDCLQMAAADPETRAVLLIGEIGGRAEEDAAAWLREHPIGKPVAAFVAGVTAPPGKRLGHAGAILEEHSGGAGAKLAALREAGISLCASLDEVPKVMAELL
ncbi:succinyl-CoA synthetase, alpha subunit [Desulfovibrio sp. X2]|uniref:succinate--CoA ligase subunit alpha n=1 Tax=Desulfovibrio sp. X2 TaxID=941449 RepID=UPI000358B7E3|nr:succinate--CoA ligase subunit alpha [Desulfovibrio sp. X2]EPR38711.1 succinyl-CoA synthetase, alpha subunit [Desulfovibrio sp. X2]